MQILTLLPRRKKRQLASLPTVLGTSQLSAPQALSLRWVC